MSRIAIIKKDNCKGGKECPYICRKYCPRVRTGDETITIGEDGKPVISEELCVGCGICVKKCDFNAITIVNLPEELNLEPIHQYGINSFRLFRLPVPRKGSVVGLIGENGIGKSTALKILGGILKPNLGKYDEDVEWDEIIERFSATELMNYLIQLRDKEIRISYKPQYVTNLPSIYKKSLGELLDRANENGNMDTYIDKFSLRNLLDHTLGELSGGELQRAAIAACLSKDANFFFLDEPSSFLDINQRLIVAKEIRNTAKSGNSVIVVEHDLLLLDYLTDFVHILYGKVGAFGVVSLLKNARAGINTYLSGYIRDENIRFRQDSIKFETKPPVNLQESDVLVRFEAIEKKLGKFRLQVVGGEIYTGEVIGVLGPNGIGKTTFVKILAGVEEADKGKVSMEISVSYKPQYLSTNSEITVKKLLSSVCQDFSSGWYKSEIIRPLDIQPLMNKPLNQLSGGELQRVAIAEALSRDAQIYLLDEPAAYLDVEQRMSVARVIKRIMEQKNSGAIIVDHDLLFLDYLSNRLMVFSGMPGEMGVAEGPFDLRTGMNRFLRGADITFRRDHETNRPRANKPGSQKDIEQKRRGEYYYI